MVAIVTGGSRGIGKAIVEELLKINYSVIVTARNKTEEISNLEKSFENKLFFVPCDISNPNERKSLFDFAQNTFGIIDLLVNNAGVAPRERKDILDITPEDFDYLTDINLKGTFFVTQEISPLLIKNKKSRIVNIS